MIPRDRTCLACVEAVAAWRLTEAARLAWPESEVLCVVHLRAVLAGRKAAAAAAREAARIWCACGREMYLAGRQRCEACRLGLAPLPPVVAPLEPVRPVGKPPERVRPDGSCLRCGKPGRLYPGGRYCGDPCGPALEAWMVHPHRYANRLDALMAAYVPAEPFPEPVITPRPCPAPMLPQGAARFLRLAEQHGWRAGASYSLGYKADRRSGLPTSIVATVNCQARRGQEVITARYEGKPGEALGFKGASVLPNEHGGWPPRPLSSAEVTAGLALPPLDPAAELAETKLALDVVCEAFPGAQLQTKDGSWW